VSVKFRENGSIRSRITPFFGNPIWRPVAILGSEMYVFCQLVLNRMPFYANVENFMPIGLPVHKLERFYYCGLLAKNSYVVWFLFLGGGGLEFPEHKINCWTF
jgi:hypothetical protein